MFPLWLGQMLMQRTEYSEIDVLEPSSIFLRKELSDSEITERVTALHDQLLSLVRDEKQVTTESWGRLLVFGIKLDLPFLHQFFEANRGANCIALAKIAKEAWAWIIL